MKDIIKSMLEHPIATCIVMCAVATLAKSVLDKSEPVEVEG